MTVQASLMCPECGSSKVVKDGIRYFNDGSQAQRWLCRGCFYRFVPESSKRRVTNNGLRECAELKEPKNSLSLVSYTTENLEWTSRENLQSIDLKGKMLEFAFQMQRDNLSPFTIKTYTDSLKRLEAQGANLLDPENVKEVLAKLPLSINSKFTMKCGYSSFLKFIGLSWKPPRIKREQKIPFIPLESEIDCLIAGTAKTTSLILQLLKETGMRIGEALRLKWININTENKTIILNEPEKHCNARIFRLSSKLLCMLEAYPKKSERIFPSPDVRTRDRIFRNQRIRLAEKLGNPRLRQITFHTLRHWVGTMEFHKTHDSKHVQMLLGHKCSLSTDIYINIEKAIFNEYDNEFHVKVAETLEEACKLLEVGFQYECDMEGKKIFKKRK